MVLNPGPKPLTLPITGLERKALILNLSIPPLPPPPSYTIIIFLFYALTEVKVSWSDK